MTITNQQVDTSNDSAELKDDNQMKGTAIQDLQYERLECNLLLTER